MGRYPVSREVLDIGAIADPAVVHTAGTPKGL
jgi:hypothetical protein